MGCYSVERVYRISLLTKYTNAVYHRRKINPLIKFFTICGCYQLEFEFISQISVLFFLIGD